jgi:hypothetical protein
MPAIDPTWLPRENGAITGSWFLLLRYSIAHSAGGVWFEHGVNQTPMLGRQVGHLAVVMNDVLCAVRVEDGLCVPALDEVRDELTARLDELQAVAPDVVASIIEAIGRSDSDVEGGPAEATPAPGAKLEEEIEALTSKKSALAFAELHEVEGLDDSMKLRDMKAKLVSALTKPAEATPAPGAKLEEPKAD